MTTIGYATLQIIPSLRGGSPAIGKELGDLSGVGKKAGGQIGDGIASGIASKKAAVEKASAQVAKLRDKEADAAGKVRAEEAKLQTLRDKGITDAGRLTAAEERVAKARRDHTAATRNTESAAKSLTSAQEAVAQATDDAGKAADRQGNALASLGDKAKSVGSKLLSVGKYAAIAAGSAGVGLLAVSLKKGFDRLNSLDQAEAKLRGLGRSAADITSIMDSVNASVKGTAFGLADAAQSAATFSTVGVKSGADMDRVMKLLADTTAQAGSEFSEMTPIFSKIIAQGGLTTITFDQLNERATGVGEALSKHLGIPLDQVRDKAKGIKFEEFAAAMEKNIGGAAQKTGETFQGAWDNAQAALGRVGAKLLTPVFKAAPPVFEKISTGLDQIGKVVEPVIGGLADKLGNIFSNVDLDFSSIGDSFTSVWDKISGPLESIKDTFTEDIVPAAERVGEVGARVGNVLSGAFGGASPVLSTVAGIVSGALAIAFNVLGGIIGGVSIAISAMSRFFDENRGVVIAIAAVIGTILLPYLAILAVGYTQAGIAAAVSGAQQLAAWVTSGGGAVKNAAISVAASWRVVGGWIAMGGGAVKQAALVVAGWATTAAKALWGAGVQAAQGAVVAASWTAMGARAVAQGAVIAGAWVASVARAAVATAATAGYAIAQGAVTVATGAWTAAQWLLNAAFLANPLTWIIVGVVALIAAIVLIATKTTWFQTAWETVWNAVKTVFTAAWNGIKAAFSAVWNFIKTNWSTIVMVITGPIGVAVGLVIKNWDRIKGAVSAVWNFVKTATAAVVNWFVAKWNTVVEFFTGFTSSVTAKISELWENIKAGANLAKDWIVDKFNAVVDFFTGLPGKIASVANAIFEPLQTAAKSVFNAVARLWNNTVGKLSFKAPSWVPGLGGKGFSVPKIPEMATGGVIADRDRYGQLTGPGTGTSDSILGVNAAGVPVVRVSAGEGVVKEQAMSSGGNAVVAALNAGWVPSAEYLSGLPGLAAGGTIGREPYGLPIGTNTGGYGSSGDIFPQWVHDVEREWNLKASTYPGHQEGSGQNKGIDWVGSVDDMHKFALHLRSIREQLEQVIWMHPQTGEKIGVADGEIVGPGTSQPGYYRDDWDGHANHVHTRQSYSFSATSDPEPEPDPEVAIVPEDAPPTVIPDTGETVPDSSTSAPEQKRMKSFRELGQDVGGIMADGLAETLGLPSWITDPGNAIKIDEGDSVRTTDSGTEPGTTPPIETPDGEPEVVAPAEPELDAKDYAGWITKAAKDMKLPEKAAVIGNATGLVESGDPMQMYANNAVPESLRYPHDAISSDHDSVGLFQQRDNGAWGTVEQRMNPYESAKLFYGALLKVSGWEGMEEGSAAQAVQRSAFPGKYSLKVPKARDLVKATGLYDSGGWLNPGEIAVNKLRRPEPVLHPDHWDAVVDQTDAVHELVGTGGRGGLQVTIYGQTTQEIVGELRREEWRGARGYGSRTR